MFVSAWARRDYSPDKVDRVLQEMEQEQASAKPRTMPVITEADKVWQETHKNAKAALAAEAAEKAKKRTQENPLADYGRMMREKRNSFNEHDALQRAMYEKRASGTMSESWGDKMKKQIDANARKTEKEYRDKKLQFQSHPMEEQQKMVFAKSSLGVPADRLAPASGEPKAFFASIFNGNHAKTIVLVFKRIAQNQVGMTVISHFETSRLKALKLAEKPDAETVTLYCGQNETRDEQGRISMKNVQNYHGSYPVMLWDGETVVALGREVKRD